jgi:hypothetical protein
MNPTTDEQGVTIKEDRLALETFLAKLQARGPYAPLSELPALADLERAIKVWLHIVDKPDPMLALLATLTKHRQVMLDLLPEDAYREVHEAVEKATR